MKRLNETAAAGYTGPAPTETRWVRASDVLLCPFTLLRADNARTQDGIEKAFLHVMFGADSPNVKDSLDKPLDNQTEYTISSSGRAIMEVVALIDPQDYPIGNLILAPVQLPNGNTRHTLRDLDEWQNEQQTADQGEVDAIPF